MEPPAIKDTQICMLYIEYEIWGHQQILPYYRLQIFFS